MKRYPAASPTTTSIISTCQIRSSAHSVMPGVSAAARLVALSVRASRRK